MNEQIQFCVTCVEIINRLYFSCFFESRFLERRLIFITTDVLIGINRLESSENFNSHYLAYKLYLTSRELIK